MRERPSLDPMSEQSSIYSLYELSESDYYMTRTLTVDSDTARERESLRNAKEPAAEQKFIVFRTRAHMPPTKEKAAPPPRGRGGRGRPPIQGPAKRLLTK